MVEVYKFAYHRNLKIKICFVIFYSVSLTSLATFINHKLTHKVFKDDIIDTEFKFYLIATHNAVGSIIGCSINLALDCLPVIFMSCAVAMVNGLSRKIEKIGHEIQKPGKKIDNQENRHVKELVECVEIHLKVKKFTQNIEEHFSTIILVQGLMSSVILCTTVYLLSMVNFTLILSYFLIFHLFLSKLSPIKDTSLFMDMASYLIPMTLQIFLPCVFGQMIHDAFEKLNTSLYSSGWIQRDQKFKNAMKIMMENCKKPVKISAFRVFNVDLETFKRIGNTAFSLYTVLKSF